MQVEGKIKMIGEVKKVGAGDFVKIELVVTTEEQYPQHILIEFVQDKVDLVDPYKVGEAVKVSINLRGREWVDPQGVTKYFNQIQGWRIERQDTSKHPQPAADNAAQYKAPAPAAALPSEEEEDDDLPF
ncbi:DUF3127 domain-containing protein [Flavobacterium caseinilyticum]|uniref:DUF3127 domain-containing protein n=1 Tax=Flavobacterium caseinilyticum TaxID=2541732 RepID=A0A4R5AY51_9FLAO|nr:DUF3127 domain-containing protein [Flavobacterium caseinilyticum]TDD77090.1 DUF3127 domain-containing protein [Flavobacterium caseinilyticum]